MALDTILQIVSKFPNEYCSIQPDFDKMPTLYNGSSNEIIGRGYKHNILIVETCPRVYFL